MTTHRLEVGLREDVDDPRGEAALRQARRLLQLPVTRVRTRTVYKLAMQLAEADLERVRQALTDPVIEESATGRLPLPACQWVIDVGFRPGVTDNVGRTALVFVRDLLGEPVAQQPGAQVFTETLYMVDGTGLERAQVEQLARELLANTLIERIHVWSAGAYAASSLDLEIPAAGSLAAPRTEVVALPDSDEELLALSQQRMLSLSIEELQAIRSYYRSPAVQQYRAAAGLPAAPTDAELEALAQTWSEHCKHKIFSALIDYTDEQGRTEQIRSLFKTFIVGCTERIAPRVGWLVSVFHDNAGVVRLDAQTHLVYKVETHNSPSALDPYGGAMTGIVGVNRDPFGTGIGAALLTNVWGYCFAPPDYAAELPEGLLHPRRVREGVHQGVIDGGNQSGIPYSRGWERFDDRFLGKPLVFCGTVGVMPARVMGQPSERKHIESDDVIVMVGGRIGKDGIHGATFSSEALHGESPAQAVQIGDPITQKKMTDMLLEARDRGLYRAITDNGAGGLSSSVGEMARLSGGAELELARAPLKYPGLMPWEILLSEAQERMTLAVPPDRVDALLELAQRREVEATAIGRFTNSGRLVVRHGGEPVLDLDLQFLHDGCPRMQLVAQWTPPLHPEPAEAGIDLAHHDPSQLLLGLMGRLDLCAREHIERQYDHEVKGLSVIKPLVGVHGDVRADATVMRVQHDEDAAILLAEGVNPRLSDIDAGIMGAHVVDLAVRRIVAGGGRLGRIAALDNFCWPDPVQSERTPDGHQKLAALVRCCRALAAMCDGLDLPLISGKDSMKNDSVKGGVKISIPPTLLVSTLGWMDDARRALDLVIPAAGHDLYVLGRTHGPLGGSELYAMLGDQHGLRLSGREAPRVRAEETRAVCRALQAAHEAELVSAAHAPHLGGLGAGLATMGLAAGLGLALDLDSVPVGGEPTILECLYAECGARFIAAAAPERRADLGRLLDDHGVPWARCGVATQTPRLVVTGGGRTVLSVELADLHTRYRGGVAS